MDIKIILFISIWDIDHQLNNSQTFNSKKKKDIKIFVEHDTKNGMGYQQC